MLVKSVEINIFHVNNRRGALCLSQGSRMGYPAWRTNHEKSSLLCIVGPVDIVIFHYKEAIFSEILHKHPKVFLVCVCVLGVGVGVGVWVWVCVWGWRCGGGGVWNDQCQYNAIQYTMILYTVWQWLRQNINKYLYLKIHPIPQPHRQAMGCLLGVFVTKSNKL